ncbi:MAG: DUF4810 domain-containing protein [Pseudomonadales bacterium]|jgi:hypothetical protein|nr:DUF4810 domain-containing protein [Pseudomonadales bacterium]
MTMNKLSIGGCAALASLLLTSCVAPPRSLYQWENYQPQLYEYFKGGSIEAQVAELERGLVVIRAKNALPPPGYHAQLGLLYSSLGKEDQMVQEFQTEKSLFPEAAPYMDFLLNNARQAATARAQEGN